MAEHEFDVVVFGATSVTGRNVAAYLAERTAGTDLSWAAAARDPGKLERTMAEVGVSPPATIIADVGDPASLLEMASRARAVVNLVGPYTLHATPVIEACVSGGAHYVDLTGEIPFARRMLDRFDAAAADAGVKIVQTCGFESLPPDLAVLLATERATERWGEGLSEVDLEVHMRATPPGLPRPSDWISGGTFQSVAAIAGDADADRLSDPALLVTDPEAAEAIRSRSPLKLAPRRGPSGAVLAPMAPAAFINPAVIHRTAVLNAGGDGFEPFRYREGVAIPGPGPTLPLRYAAAGSVAGLQAGIAALARTRPATRERIGKRLGSLLPSSGFGPAADRLEQWRWRMRVFASTNGGNRVEVTVDAEGHPGYLATARMMGEAGLLLAEPGATPERAGHLTPAAALGSAGIARFERAKMRFTVS